MSKGKYMDALAELSADDSDSSGSDEETEPKDSAPKKQNTGKIDLEALERCGYKSGPSVLLMPAPKEQQQSNWAWDNGESQKKAEDTERSAQDRQATREAVTTAIDASAAISRRAMELKEQNYHARREERAEMLGRTFGKPPDKKKDTFNTKEKRKRDAGQATRGKNFVEEEKRMGRELGIYSGFD